MRMAEQNGTHLMSGVLAGVAGGLVASWVMNVFMEQAGPKIVEAVQSVQGENGSRPQNESAQSQSHDDAPKEDATMKTADAIVSTVTGGRHLSMEEKQKGGPIVHYAFGALMGGLYGGLAEVSPVARAGFGTVFASLLFAGADLVAVPALRLSGSSADAPVSSLATPFAAHLVYGLTTESVRRVVRAALSPPRSNSELSTC
jgi:putative membrane protein